MQLQINILAGSSTENPHSLVVLIRLIGNSDNQRSTVLRLDLIRTLLDVWHISFPSLTHGAEPFLGSRQLCSYSRTYQQFMKTQGSLPCSQEPSTGPYLQSDQSNPKNPSRSEASCDLSQQAYFLRWGIISPTTNPQAGGPPIFRYQWLLIQYIRSYPSYLVAVSSIRNLRTRHAMVTRDPLNIRNLRTRHAVVTRDPLNIRNLRTRHAVVARNPLNMTSHSHKWREWKEIAAVCFELKTSVVGALPPDPTSLHPIIWNLK
jgi:hypothetical protein